MGLSTVPASEAHRQCQCPPLRGPTWITKELIVLGSGLMGHCQQWNTHQFQPDVPVPPSDSMHTDYWEFQENTFQEIPHILCFQFDCKLPEQHFLQLAVTQTSEQNTQPQNTFPPWNVWTEAYEIIRILKEQFSLSFNTMIESRGLIFPSLPIILTS